MPRACCWCRCELIDYRHIPDTEPRPAAQPARHSNRRTAPSSTSSAADTAPSLLSTVLFARGPGSRPDPALYKTVICRNWRTGDCRYGVRCAFAHGATELRQVRPRAVLVAFRDTCNSYQGAFLLSTLCRVCSKAFSLQVWYVSALECKCMLMLAWQISFLQLCPRALSISHKCCCHQC